MLNPMDMTGRTILITGASSGIGRATALLADQLGARVILVARNAERLSQTYRQMSGSDHRIDPFDLNRSDELPIWLKSIAQEAGPIHGVAHCAGAHLLRPLQILKSAQVEETLGLNVVSAIMLAKAFRQKGVRADGASIVFISSVMGEVGEAGCSVYCASKGALHALTRSLALELARENIRVNCVAPATVLTEMSSDVASALGEDRMNEIKRLHPLGFGRPLDVANAIAFLLTDAARWTTGSIHYVDGGYTAQ